MKKQTKNKSFIYNDLGFPIKLINVPTKIVFGETVLDINLGKFQRNVLHALAYKSQPLTALEIRFIRKYLELTTTAFGQAFGVTHAAVLKWESGQGHIPPTTELCVRLFVLDRLSAKNEEFGKFYHKITIQSLVQQQKNEQNSLLEFDVNQKLAFA